MLLLMLIILVLMLAMLVLMLAMLVLIPAMLDEILLEFVLMAEVLAVMSKILVET